jgi:hypothetical protein
MSLSQELGQLTGHMTKRSGYNFRHIPQVGGSGDQPLTAKTQPLTRRQSREQFLNYMGHLSDKARRSKGLGPRTADLKPSDKPPTMSKNSPGIKPQEEYKPKTPQSPMPK